METKKQSIYYRKIEVENQLQRERNKGRGYTYKGLLYITVLILCVFSEINMLSTTFYSSITSGKNIFFSWGYGAKHLFWIVVGLLGMYFFSKIPPSFYKKSIVKPFMILGSLTVLALMPLGARIIPNIIPKINGAISWIRVGGLSIQPAEIFKIVYIITMARLLEGAQKRRYGYFKIIGHIAPIFLVYTFLIFLQHDLGTMLHYTAITFVMFLVSPLRKKEIFWTLASIFLLVVIAFFIFYHSNIVGGEDYLSQRINSYMDILFRGDEYDTGYGYQVIQSLIAIGRGGLIGVGYGNGIQKYNYLPEIQTDFISSSLGEEWGLLGLLLVISLFLLILRIGLKIGEYTKTPFERYLCVGLVSLIFIQLIINMYVATGLMPVTGLTFPLFSYGGSSMITVLCSIGVLLSINSYSFK